MTTAKEQKPLSDFHNVESEVTSLNSKPYPDNVYVGKAIDNGSCFFDSFRQGLEQQKGIQVTVEQLRKDCKEFAQNNPPEWFENAIAHSYDNNGQYRSETVDEYIANIMSNNRWGDPEVEGRILCEKYGVKLHVVEDQSYFKSLQREVSQDRGGFSVEIKQAIMDSNSNEALTQKLQEIDSDEAFELLVNMTNFDGLDITHQLISPSENMSLNHPIIHMMNEGRAHFEPLLDINKSLAKQLQEETKLKQEQEQEDHLLAKKLQVDEILEYFNIAKDGSIEKEVEKILDGLLAKNTNQRN
ncbi:hypothetical protein [Wolbachia endosymbiont of Cantharis cryptica]|uniref:hypothetical protein n=1 Tax=Wolbachia endosymbiont of Cantharis cryptica TaxID=3066132 RepID=UPI00376F28E2